MTKHATVTGGTVGSVTLGEFLRPYEFPPLHDSGKRAEFSGGAVRDTAEGKPRFDLVSPFYWLASSGAFPTALRKVVVGVAMFQITHKPTYLLDALQALGVFVGEVAGVSPELLLAGHYEAGAKKYADRNWEKGIPCTRYIGSFWRHFVAYAAGKEDEPHGSAAMWNLVGLLHTLLAARAGTLSGEFSDLPGPYVPADKANELLKDLGEG